MKRPRKAPYRLLAAVTICLAAGAARGPASAALPSALAAAYAKDVEQPACVAKLEKAGEQQEVTLNSGQRIFLVHGICGCGAMNCTVGVYAPEGDGYRTVLLDVALKFDAEPNGTLVTTSAGDGFVSGRRTYRWNGNTYVLVSDLDVYKNAYTKPSLRIVQFAPGTSSTTVSSTQVTQHFSDYFKLDATKGQALSLTFEKRDPKVNALYLNSAYWDPRYSVWKQKSGSSEVALAQSGDTYTAKLPSSGAYLLEIDGADETFRSYTLKIAVR